MGGDDFNWGEEMKWGKEPPSPRLCPEGAASSSPAPTPQAGGVDLPLLPGNVTGYKLHPSFYVPSHSQEDLSSPNMVPVAPTHALYGSFHSQSHPGGVRYSPSHFQYKPSPSMMPFAPIMVPVAPGMIPV